MSQATPSSTLARASVRFGEWEQYREAQQKYLGEADRSASGRPSSRDVHMEEIKTAPIFSADVLDCVIGSENEAKESLVSQILPQYGLLAAHLHTFSDERVTDKGEANIVMGVDQARIDDPRMFLNINAPWSAFICGSQGSGKSHTLCCMLEASLTRSKLGPLVQPLAGIVFHYDRHTSVGCTQICEAAYLASSGIPVTIMVSPTTYVAMKQAYENLKGYPQNIRKPRVVPLYLEEKHLNVDRMMKLMAVDEAGRVPLYMEVRRYLLIARAQMI